MYRYSLLGRLSKPSKGSRISWICSKPRLVLVFISLVIILIFMIGGRYLIWGTRMNYPTFSFLSVADSICDDSPSNAAKPDHVIPNLVHYVWLLKDPAELRLGFKFFVSIYSAHLFWRPDRIYIHTDAAAEVISRARDSGTPWTRRILAIPNLEFNHVVAPLATNKGVKIERTEHRADFLRLSALREFGGVYLDTDAIPLRDIADLRTSGFRAVVGQQLGLSFWQANRLNNGVMMAAPHSNLMTIFYHSAHEFFDGEWDTASIRLLTDLGNRLAALPHEVLILQPQAFNPVSWQSEDQHNLFEPALDPTTALAADSAQREQDLRAKAAGGSEEGGGTCGDVLAWMKQREMGRKGGKDKGKEEKGELDFSSSYVLHAFDNGMGGFLGEGREIDVRYVVERRSNYARAVFPAVWRAVEEGVIPREEVSWEGR